MSLAEIKLLKKNLLTRDNRIRSDVRAKKDKEGQGQRTGNKEEQRTAAAAAAEAKPQPSVRQESGTNKASSSAATQLEQRGIQVEQMMAHISRQNVPTKQKVSTMTPPEQREQSKPATARLEQSKQSQPTARSEPSEQSQPTTEQRSGNNQRNQGGHNQKNQGGQKRLGPSRQRGGTGNNEQKTKSQQQQQQIQQNAAMQRAKEEQR